MPIKYYSSITNENLLAAEKLILPRAVSGDYPAICDMLLILSHAVEQAVPLTPALSRFLADALRKISEGGDPKAAFNIKRKRGGKDTRAAGEKNVLLAAQVAKLLSQSESMTIENAIAKIAETACVPEETVKAAWRDYRHSVELTEYGAVLTFAKVKTKKE